MTPRKKSNIHKLAEISFDPINDPQTIPAGWDVAAFYEPERELQQTYRVMTDNQTTSSPVHDGTQDFIS